MKERLKELYQKLSDLEENFSSPDHELLIFAEETDRDDVLDIIGRLMSSLSDMVRSYKEDLAALVGEKILNNEKITPEDLDQTAAIADEFEASDDELLQSQAQILDKILFVFAESNDESLQEKYRRRNFEDNYVNPRKELQKSFRVAETKKALDQINKNKIYRPMESPLSTRHCPDHPGTMFKRVDDYVFQCPLDNRIYDYKEGFTTLKGNVVSGGSVSNQWNDNDQLHDGQLAFDSRESKLNG